MRRRSVGHRADLAMDRMAQRLSQLEAGGLDSIFMTVPRLSCRYDPYGD